MEPVSQYVGGNQLDMRARAAGVGRYANVEARARRPLASRASNSKVADPPPRQRRSSSAQRARPIPGTGRDVEGRTLTRQRVVAAVGQAQRLGLDGRQRRSARPITSGAFRGELQQLQKCPDRYHRVCFHAYSPTRAMMDNKMSRSVRASELVIAGPSVYPSCRQLCGRVRRFQPQHSRRNGANTVRGHPRYRKALHNNRPITTMMPTKTNRSIRASSSGIAGPSAHPHGATSGD